MTKIRTTSYPLVSLRDIIDKKMENILHEGIKLCEPLIQYEKNVIKALDLEYSLRKLKAPSIEQWQDRLNQKANVVAELLQPLIDNEIVLKWRPIYKGLDYRNWNSNELIKEFVNDCLNSSEEDARIYNLMMSECVLLGKHRKEISNALADWPPYCLLTSYATEFICSQCDNVWHYQQIGKTRPSFRQLYCPHCGMTANMNGAFLKGDFRKLSFVDPSIMTERLQSLCKLVDDLASNFHKDEFYVYQEDLDKHIAEFPLLLTSEEEQMLNEIIRLGGHAFSPYHSEYYIYREHSAFNSLIDKNVLIPTLAINIYEYIQELAKATISFSWSDNLVGRMNKIKTGDLTLAIENTARRFVSCKFNIEGRSSINSILIFQKIFIINPALNSLKNKLTLEYIKPKEKFLFGPIPEIITPQVSSDEYFYIYRIDWEFKGDKCAYIGKRKSKVPPEQDTEYMGSGSLLKAAKKLAKLHDENCFFRKTILKTLPISVDPLWYEQLAISELKELEPKVRCYNEINAHGALAKALQEVKKKVGGQ